MKKMNHVKVLEVLISDYYAYPPELKPGQVKILLQVILEMAQEIEDLKRDRLNRLGGYPGYD